jgi:hypothetical protein
MGLAIPAQQANPTPSLAQQREHSLENKFGISLAVNPKEGSYTLQFGGERWLGKGLVSVLENKRWCRSAEVKYREVAAYDRPQKLLLTDMKTGKSSDFLGSYQSIELAWQAPDSTTAFATGFRLYSDAPCLVFVQKFPHGFKNYASGSWIVPSVVFPQFLPEFDERNDLYSWTSGGMFTHRFGYGNAASLGGTVDLLLLADKDRRAIILSPYANYLVATQQCAPVASEDETDPSKLAINCGIEGLVTDLPDGYEHQHILVAGPGIHNTFESWGKALLARSGKKVPSKYSGDNMKYAVYWDDYGSYYREHGFKEDGYRFYEDIIIGVAEDARKHGLRIGAYQVQDEDQMRLHEGLFEPRQDLFPHGLKWLSEKLGAPLEAYLCWIDPNGPYRKKYPFFETPKGYVPGDSMGDVFYSETFWNDTANKLASWGTTLLQQDYQSVYEGDPVMMSNLNRMNSYFKNMANALSAKGMTIQYCMQLPRNIMESTENPIMVSLQGSWDHHVNAAEPEHRHTDDDPYVWKHLIFSTAFYGAVGIWPSRDNIQTIADPNAYEDVLLANLLGGEIQLGHRIGECNFELLRKTYREGDGLILKPDRPIAPLDRCYIEGGAVGYTESNKNGRSWYYVLSLPSAGYLPEFCPADLGGAGRWAVYNLETRVVSIKDASSPIPLEREAKHEYFVVAPLLENGIAVIGDVEKFVTMADMRIATVEAVREGARVGVISNQEWNPVTVGFAAQRPAGVEVGDAKLEEVSSLDRLRTAHAGWFWNYQTKLWHVKVDFAGAVNMETRVFTIH